MATLLVTGGSGFVGSKVSQALRAHGHDVVVTYHEHADRVAVGVDGFRAVALDLNEPGAEPAARLVREVRPAAVAHLAAMSELSACQRDPERAERINVVGTRAMVEACRAIGAVMLFASTDQVFDGERAPYRESDAPEPLHSYGRTKLRAEAEVAALRERGLSLRISLVYGESPTGRRSASEQVVNQVSAGESPKLFADEFRTPILVDDVAAATAELLQRMLDGDLIVPGDSPRVLHLGGPERVSRFEFGTCMAEAFGFDERLLTAASRADVSLDVARPRDVSLDSTVAQRVLRTRIRGVREGLASLGAASLQRRETHAQRPIR
jgi:dTDP-4-dehydrorhamnose reductase